MRFTSLILAAALAVCAPAQGRAAHCLFLFEPCKYAAGFSHFDYVNPNAPKGGSVKLAEMGTFDSLHLFALKGVKAPGLTMLYDSLMVRSEDEPQSYYGLIASDAVVAPDKRSVTFTLRPEARFHDGKAITAEDAVFTLAALREKGDPFYALLLADVESAEALGEHQVRYHFKNATNRELPFIVASLPVLPKHAWEGRDFAASSVELPLGSGPYTVKEVEAGKHIIYARVKDYWAKHLGVMRGQHNFDELRYDLYRDEGVSLEAFKAGAYDFRQEYVARNWARGYDTPALKDGRMIKRHVQHAIPQGMQAFVFNTRKQQFTDRRVRQAITLAMDFEWMNKTLFFDAYARNKSFFQATPFAARGLPSEAEEKLLAPFVEQLPPKMMEEPFALPINDGSGNARTNLLKAQALLNEAGWRVKDGKRVHPLTGKPLTIEFMLRQPTMERVVGAMRKNMERLGIGVTIRRVDDAQYQKRTDTFDFDMVSIWVNQGVFYPGNEQMALWSSSQARVRGSNALSGIASPAIDAALQALVNAKDMQALTTAGRALDRLLLWEWVVIPNWHSQNFRIAYWDVFGMPTSAPKYGIGFQTWWKK